ncbi:MAG: hypothetical protein KF745_05175 [Phycisphaeraceae bacterium]|nr:hypothetical protein [Phycisphaeraceae bacterium]
MDAKRKSLMDDMPEPAQKAKVSGGKSLSNADKMKGGIAIAVLIIVGVWLAYSFGLIGGGDDGPRDTVGGVVATPEVREEIEREKQKIQQQQQRMIERGAEVGSSG